MLNAVILVEGLESRQRVSNSEASKIKGLNDRHFITHFQGFKSDYSRLLKLDIWSTWSFLSACSWKIYFCSTHRLKHMHERTKHRGYSHHELEDLARWAPPTHAQTMTWQAFRRVPFQQNTPYMNTCINTQTQTNIHTSAFLWGVLSFTLVWLPGQQFAAIALLAIHNANGFSINHNTFFYRNYRFNFLIFRECSSQFLFILPALWSSENTLRLGIQSPVPSVSQDPSIACSGSHCPHHIWVGGPSKESKACFFLSHETTMLKYLQSFEMHSRLERIVWWLYKKGLLGMWNDIR